MGGAVARGLLASGFDPKCLTIANPHTDRGRPLAEAGCSVTADNLEAIGHADLIIIAVKPWILPSVAAQLRGHIDCGRQEVSLIVAGISVVHLLDMRTDGGTAPALSIASL